MASFITVFSLYSCPILSVVGTPLHPDLPPRSDRVEMEQQGRMKARASLP